MHFVTVVMPYGGTNILFQNDTLSTSLLTNKSATDITSNASSNKNKINLRNNIEKQKQNENKSSISRCVETRTLSDRGARCSFVVRAFARAAMGLLIDPSWPIELFLVPASDPQLV